MTDRAAPSNWMLALLACAQLIIALDATIVFVALPEISRALDFSAQRLQWVVSAYTVAFGGFLLLGGRATDLLGRRRMYVLGQSLYALASLAGGLAQSELPLILARAVQGLGGALLFPATLALIGNHFAEGPARNRALAIWSIASAFGLALGSALGGALTELFGWASIFLVNVPLAGAAALLALRLIPADARRQRGRRFDLAGALTVTAGATLLVFALVQGPESGWDAPSVRFGLYLSVPLLLAFLAIEHYSRDPLMPLRLLGNRNLQVAMLLTAIFMSSYGVQYYFLAIYFQSVYGYSVLQTGLAFLPATLLCTLGIRVAERLLARHGARATLVAGLLLGALGLGLLAACLPLGRGFLALLPAIVILSVGQGMTWTAMWVSAASGVDPAGTGRRLGDGLDDPADRRRARPGPAGGAGQRPGARRRCRQPAGQPGARHRMGDRAQRPARPVRRRPGPAPAPRGVRGVAAESRLIPLRRRPARRRAPAPGPGRPGARRRDGCPGARTALPGGSAAPAAAPRSATRPAGAPPPPAGCWPAVRGEPRRRWR